ncbi:MAG: dynamin family protein [Helicobacteraceae bacterium]
MAPRIFKIPEQIMELGFAYFQITHRQNISDLHASFIQNVQVQKGFEPSLAVLFLCLTQTNFYDFCALGSSGDALLELFGEQKIEKSQLELYQTALFMRLDPNDKTLDSAAQRLKETGFISGAGSARIKTLLYALKPPKIQTQNRPAPMQSRALLDLLALLENIKLDVTGLDAARESLKRQKFTISVTGAINAGKSSLINALLGREILGESVVPETANITIIRSAQKEESAKINFYTPKEWQALELAAHSSKPVQDLVSQTKQALPVQDLLEQKCARVPLSGVVNYTSAAYSNFKSNLVSSVEISVFSPFLNEQLELIDTPGIDDPITIREELTKKQLASTNLLIHLTNAAQSASQKDVEFLIDALIYQKIPRALVLITKADLFSKEQIKESVEFTKKTVLELLRLAKKEASSDEILQRIDFLSVSSLALAQGHTSESGFDELKNYFEKTIKNDEQLALIVRAARSRAQAAMQGALDEAKEELENMQKGEEALRKSVRQKEQLSAQRLLDLRAKATALAQKTQAAKEHINSLDGFIGAELDYLQQKLSAHWLESLHYNALGEHKMDNATLGASFGFALKDNIIDIVRDYRYAVLHYLNERGLAGQNLSTEAQDLSASGRAGGEFYARFLAKNNSAAISALQDLNTQKLKNKEALKLGLEALIKNLLQDLKASLEAARDAFKAEVFAGLNARLDFSAQERAVAQDLSQARAALVDLNAGELEARMEQTGKKIALISSYLEALKASNDNV